MSSVKVTKKNEKIVYIIYAVLFIILVACFWGFKESITPQMIAAGDLNDERSTLWPVLISLVATLLGSLITTYVFLKEALDRTVDEKPYYRLVIEEYRETTMRQLWWYSLSTILLMGIVICFYVMFYFFSYRAIWALKLTISIFYIFCMAWTAKILKQCIDINNGLGKEAESLLAEKNKQVKKYIKEFHPETLEGITKECKTIAQWLQIEDKYELCPICVSKEKYINRFSEWEKFLKMLIEGGKGFFDKQPGHEQIRSVILEGEKIFKQNDIEDFDAVANGWSDGGYAQIRNYIKVLDISGESFCDIYTVLEECRNLFQVQLEVNRGTKEDMSSHIGDGEKEISQLFLIFLIYMSTRVFCTIPKIEVFFPAGKFQYINFYNTRFENSAFRASSFKHGVFARSKIMNSNFGMSLFQNCEFFSADSRDCSMSNVLFENCSFQETIFENVDFTGTNFQNCDLKKANFNDSILSNMEINNTEFGRNNFTNCKIWNLALTIDKKAVFEECNFSNSDLQNINIKLLNEDKICFEEEKNYTVKRFLNIITEKKLINCYKNQETEKVKGIVERFSVSGKNFCKTKVQRLPNMRCKTISDSIWDSIEKTVVIQMKENLFVNTQISGVVFYRVNLEQSVFSSAQMDGIHLIGVDMVGSILDKANMRESLLFGVNMQSTVLADAIFFRAFCKIVNMEDSSLCSLHGAEAQMEYCSFNRSDCCNIDLTKATVKKSTFRDALLRAAELTDAVFEEVCLENCIANDMLSSYSLFRKCSLRNAFLQGSNFNYTVFEQCDFSYADLSNSAVTNVKFRRCNFHESNFRNTCFINAYFEDNYSIKGEIFENCHFINPKFKGNNGGLEILVKASNKKLKKRLGGQNFVLFRKDH